MGHLAGRTYSNLELKDLDVSQAEAFFAHINANREFFVETIPFVSRTHDLETMTKNIERNLARQAEGIGEFYTLWDGNTMAGYFLVREKDFDAGWAEIGYMIGKAWAGRGITTAICRDMIDDLFANQGMGKVVICCNDDNFASIAVAKKLGFTLEGNIRRHFVVNGKIRNMMYFGLLKEEWLQRTDKASTRKGSNNE
jgi:ribosomal-protein-serine acetyltransferase